MGLLYQFPATEAEQDRIEYKDKMIVLKSYGLPLIFWGYMLAILSVIFIMIVAIKEPLLKMMTMDDPLNRYLALIVLATLIATPLSLVTFFFYEKTLSKEGKDLKIGHRFFWIPFFSRQYTLKSENSFEIEHFLDAPNMARIQGKKEMRGFQNKGHFECYAILENGKKIFIDRHSRKADLKKLIALLSRY